MNQPSQYAVELVSKLMKCLPETVLGCLGSINEFNVREAFLALSQTYIDKATEELRGTQATALQAIEALRKERDTWKERATKAEASNDSLLKIAEELARLIGEQLSDAPEHDFIDYRDPGDKRHPYARSYHIGSVYEKNLKQALSNFNKWKEGRK